MNLSSSRCSSLIVVTISIISKSVKYLFGQICSDNVLSLVKINEKKKRYIFTNKTDDWLMLSVKALLLSRYIKMGMKYIR